MTRQDLEQIVGAGEGLYLEFKHRLPESERIAREVTALANTCGGHLLVGVTDDGTLQGVKDPEEELYALNKAMDRYCMPEIALDVECVKVSRTRTVVVIRIPLSPSRPHYVQNPLIQKRSVFVRFEDRCIVASREARKLMGTSSEQEHTLIRLGEKERLLLKHLEQEGQITVHGFAKYAKIHPGRASRIILRMSRAGVLVHHIDLREDYFTVALSAEACNAPLNS